MAWKIRSYSRGFFPPILFLYLITSSRWRRRRVDLQGIAVWRLSGKPLLCTVNAKLEECM